MVNLLFSRTFVVLCLLCFLVGCASDSNAGECSIKSVDDLYSKYVVVDAIRYRGGLTTEEQAKSYIGSEMFFLKNNFLIRGVSISNPQYKLLCEFPLEEGEIPDKRRSYFYGFNTSRPFVSVLDVYDPSDSTGYPYVNLEIVDDQIWNLYDGWLYKMEKNNNNKTKSKGQIR